MATPQLAWIRANSGEVIAAKATVTLGGNLKPVFTAYRGCPMGPSTSYRRSRTANRYQRSRTTEQLWVRASGITADAPTCCDARAFQDPWRFNHAHRAWCRGVVDRRSAPPQPAAAMRYPDGRPLAAALSPERLATMLRSWRSAATGGHFLPHLTAGGEPTGMFYDLPAEQDAPPVPAGSRYGAARVGAATGSCGLSVASLVANEEDGPPAPLATETASPLELDPAAKVDAPSYVTVRAGETEPRAAVAAWLARQGGVAEASLDRPLLADLDDDAVVPLPEGVRHWPAFGDPPQVAWLELDEPIDRFVLAPGVQALGLHRRPNHWLPRLNPTHVYRLLVPSGVGRDVTGLPIDGSVVAAWRPGQRTLLPVSALSRVTGTKTYRPGFTRGRRLIGSVRENWNLAERLRHTSVPPDVAEDASAVALLLAPTTVPESDGSADVAGVASGPQALAQARELVATRLADGTAPLPYVVGAVFPPSMVI